MRRRDFLRAGAALLAAPSVVRAQTSKGKVRFAYLQLGWSGSEIIHKEDLLAKHGWQAEYSVVPGSPVPRLNQLTSKTWTRSTCPSRSRPRRSRTARR